MARNATFEAMLTARGAHYGEWLGTPVVDDFGDIDAEYQGLVTGLALADRSSRGTVVALGTEVVPLLQGIVTSDVFALAEPGSGQRSCAVNAKGRLVCEARLLHGPEILIMDFEPGVVEDGVISHFRANVMMEDAKFVDRSAATSILGIYGPLAAATVDKLGEFQRPVSSLPVFHGTWGTLAGADVIVRRSELGWELLLDVDDAATVWEAFEAEGATLIGETALEILRVQTGTPRWGAELDEKVIPLEAGLNDTIAYDKGCYVGQEIIARLDTLGTPAKRLRRLELTAPVHVGDDVFAEAKKVGSVRSVVRPPNGAPLALAFVKRDHNAVGVELQVGESRVAAQVEELRPQ